MCTMNAKFISDQEILDFLAESNKVTFKWSKLLFGKKHFKFLCTFWSNPESIKSLIPDEKIEEWEKDFHVINQISKLEPFMFEKYKNFITYTVSKLFKKSKSYYMYGDFINEAYIVFKKCVWYYTKNNIKFTTYLFSAIASKIQQIKYRQKNCKIDIKFYSDHVNFEQFSVYKEIFGENNQFDLSSEEFSFEKIISNCNLNDKETKAIELKFKLGRKWVKEAKSIILKSNGKSYSNYGLRIILSKAMNKLKEVYQENNFSLSI